MIDLSFSTGFPLILNPDTWEMTSAYGFSYRRISRTAREMLPVLRSPDGIAPDAELYHVYYVEQSPPAAKNLLEPYDLTYSPVVLPPGEINGEFIKTSGHYHPLIPGTPYAYPEIYTGLHGRLLLVLQKRNLLNRATPLDCTLVELTPGVSVTIPPDYAHILINPTHEIGVMAGLYGRSFKPDNSDVLERHGLAYYLLRDGNGIGAELNPAYLNPPPLIQSVTLTGTPFAPPDDPAIPLWTAFVTKPEKYAFLTQPDAVSTFFAPLNG
jgi:glucose-6-phosphate isomerase